jgi:hypothetical protein
MSQTTTGGFIHTVIVSCGELSMMHIPGDQKEAGDSNIIEKGEKPSFF